MSSTATMSMSPTSAASASASASASGAALQGGIFQKENPSIYNPKDPLTLFIIQAGIVIIFCRLLHWPLSYMRQPRVIAEVIGGILLGPSVMGRIPHFSATIFPPAALPNFTLVANLGLVLFLFLVGLEVDLRFLTGNLKIAVSVGALGMILPFGLGVAIAWGLHKDFVTTEYVPFGIFALFIGVAMSITAFPVLCRILTELRLLQTPVGIIVLAAGVSNDVVGWILLALSVTLVNALKSGHGKGIDVLYILLTVVGFVLFLVFAVRPGFMWVLRRNRTIQEGPSQGIVAFTLLLVLACAFFTAIIGVHPIFGAFIAGLIMPHEGGFAIKLTEKIEDLVSALLLPLYFALSGLNTNLGLLNSGIAWAYVIAIVVVAFTTKLIGGAVAARLCGLFWRESATIGVLMSCKGLVELIVLNIGKNAGILSPQTFTVFVIMALITTVTTTPLTAALYPPWYQKKVEAYKRGEIDWDTGAPRRKSMADGTLMPLESGAEILRVKSMLVYLRLDNLPSMIAFVSLFGGKNVITPKVIHPSHDGDDEKKNGEGTTELFDRPVEVHGVRLIELGDRNSNVMMVTETDEYAAHDPVINTFRTVGRFNNLAISGEIAIGPETTFPDMITSKATEEDSDLLLLPWSETGALHETQVISHETERAKLAASTYSAFANRALDKAVTNTVIFIDKGFGSSVKSTIANQQHKTIHRTISSLSMRTRRESVAPPAADKSHHIFLPFFGGPDGRAAVRLVLQLVENPVITATIVYYDDNNVDTISHTHPDLLEPITPGGGGLLLSPMSPTAKEAARESRAVIVPPTRALHQHDAAFFASIKANLSSDVTSRVVFEVDKTTTPVQDAVARALTEVGTNHRNGGDLIVLGRNKGWFTAGQDISRNETLGVLAGRLVEAQAKASLLVVQAKLGGGDSGALVMDG